MGSSRPRSLSTLTIGDAAESDLDGYILAQGIPKHGWRWVKSEKGDFWGVSGSGLLQVRNDRPDFPARRWVKDGDTWKASNEWQPVKELL